MDSVPTRVAVTLVGVAAAAALFATACTAGSASSGQPLEKRTTTTEARLPTPARYQPVPGEPVPDVKQLAADALQTLGTYPLGGGTVAAATERVRGLPVEPRISSDGGVLFDPAAASIVEIIYPQLGGLTATDASVMVVMRQRLLAGGAERAVTRTVDVRLTLGAAGWRVVAITSMGGDPVEAVVPSPEAEAVLASPQIELPDSARWDIEAGRIDDRVLRLLERLATEHTVSVTVLATGHPHNVFASESVSNHTLGRGVDIWAVDGMPVVSQRDPAGPLRSLVSQLLAEGVTELGSPWDLDGRGVGASFTNTVHQDHLHLAFDR